MNSLYNREDLYAGEYEHLSETEVSEYTDDGHRAVAIIRMETDLTDEDTLLEKALLHQFTDRGRCGCQHDCCGCVSVSAWSAVKISSYADGDNLWAIHLSYSRNI